MSSRRIYVGNLHPDSRKKDIEELFDNYGRITDINLVNGSGRYERAPFAFVQFEDPRDARDAVDRRDGYDFMGRKLRVEFPKGDRDRGDRGGGGRFGGRGGGDRRDGGGFHRGGGGDRGGGGSSIRRTKYRVMVAGLPASASWQDLKDHMRSAGEVAFSDVFKDGTGVVEFNRYEDMRYAVKKLEGSKFKSHERETAYISVKEDYEDGGGRSSGAGGAGGGRSRSRSGSRSKSKRDRRSRSSSRSSKSKSKSRSRSRSRSPPLYQRHPDSKSPSPGGGGGAGRNASPGADRGGDRGGDRRRSDRGDRR